MASQQEDSQNVIIFLFGVIAIGALTRLALKNTSFPYTVAMILVGLSIGFTSHRFQGAQTYTTISHLNPHLMLYIFLPPLIFESAFAMDVHIFKKVFNQILLMALPGMMIGALLTAFQARMMFDYGWSWWTSLMFGSILGATDPVAVVALLKDVGACPKLGTIMEGESLLNDGTAIVVFTLFLSLSKGGVYTGGEVVLLFLRVAIGGPIFGWLSGKLTVVLIAQVFNDALIEITLTIAASYITFYVAEAWLGVSGVLALVALGLECNLNRAHISPEVEKFLHGFWEMMAYLTNTVIFTLVGVVIAERAFNDVEPRDWFYLLSLYIGLTIIRGITIALLSPLLSRLGYGISWEKGIVVTWGGLRGAVGLSLALVVEHDEVLHHIDKKIGGKVLFLTAGIVTLTLLVNATTVKSLLKILGISNISQTKRVAMASAISQLERHRGELIHMQKEDRFLADAIWSRVLDQSTIKNPHIKAVRRRNKKNKIIPEDEAELDSSALCPGCEHELPFVLRPNEIAELAAETRVRYLKAEKRSYWRQYEIGMLGRDGVRQLNALIDTAIDIPHKLVEEGDLSIFFQIPPVIIWLRIWTLWAMLPPLIKDDCVIKWEPGSFRFRVEQVSSHRYFEWFVSLVVLVNVIVISVELARDGDVNMTAFDIINFICIGIYTVETAIKMGGLSTRGYFRHKWNIFDFAILVTSYIDIIIDASNPENTNDFDPAVLKVARFFRIMRSLRAFRLLHFALPQMLVFLHRWINRRLTLAYDIGKAYVLAREELSSVVTQLVQLSEISDKLQARSDDNRILMVTKLAQTQKDHPSIVTAVKTRQASRGVLNGIREAVRELKEDGVLDETDAEQLRHQCEQLMKKLESHVATLNPADPTHLLLEVPWLDGATENEIATIQAITELKSYELGDVLAHAGDPSNGIFIVVSGMVRIVFEVGSVKRTNFVNAGQVLGELGTLTDSFRSADMMCETAVEAFFIPGEKIKATLATYPKLADRLWRVCGIRAAVTALARLPLYTKWPLPRLKHHCEMSKVYSSAESVLWTFDERVSEAMVLEGTATCKHTGRTFLALVPIPRGVITIALAPGTRFMVIPANESLDITGLCTAHGRGPHTVVAVAGKILLLPRRSTVDDPPALSPHAEETTSLPLHVDESTES